VGIPTTGRWRGAALLAALVLAGGCGPGARRAESDEWLRSVEARTELDGDFEKAEARWRKELGREARPDDGALLTDDPPATPAAYGSVAFKETEALGGTAARATAEARAGMEAGVARDPAEREATGFWAGVRRGSDTVGRAGFAVVTVLVVVGMAVAPYLLL
jgi:hypothetical protein